jgi:hypothetical protein
MKSLFYQRHGISPWHSLATFCPSNYNDDENLPERYGKHPTIIHIFPCVIYIKI